MAREWRVSLDGSYTPVFAVVAAGLGLIALGYWLNHPHRNQEIPC